MNIKSITWKSRTTIIGLSIAILGVVDAFVGSFDLGLSPILTILAGVGIVTQRDALTKMTEAVTDRL